MKKFPIGVVVIVVFMVVYFCILGYMLGFKNVEDYQEPTYDANARFVYNNGEFSTDIVNYAIIIDKETGVQYAVIKHKYCFPLLNSDGTPIVTEE